MSRSGPAGEVGVALDGVAITPGERGFDGIRRSEVSVRRDVAQRVRSHCSRQMSGSPANLHTSSSQTVVSRLSVHSPSAPHEESAAEMPFGSNDFPHTTRPPNPKLENWRI